MAKKLLYSDYSFSVASNTLTLKGNIRPNRMLLVTDVTIGQIIYNFADPTLGYSNFTYNASDDTTVYTLDASLTGLGVADTDTLQVFYEDDHAKIDFAEAFVDPVNKLRVSNPGNLIDTDFEYGLQGTKWETLQTVQNIPTIYSSSGDVPIEGIEGITTVAGSKVVKVALSAGVTLKLGDPIVVQGVTLSFAEGAFLITGLASTTEFYYEMDQAAVNTETISGAYTTVTQAKFFQGSNLPIDESLGLGVVSDEAAPQSTITVTTPEVHGLNPRTKVYLRNTVGPKTFEVVDPTATAPDGRPFIDLTSGIELIQPVDSTLQTSRQGYLEFPVVTWDFESTYGKYLASTDINTVANTVIWNDHGLLNNYCLVFQTQIRGQTTGNLTDGTVYYVKKVDDNTIQLCTDYGTLSNVIDLTAIDTTRGHPRLSLCYKVEGKNGTLRYTAFFNRNSTLNTNGLQSAQTGIASRATQQYLVNINATSGNSIGGYGANRVPVTLVLSRVDYSGSRMNVNGAWAYFGDGTPPGRLAQHRIGAVGATSGTQFPNVDIFPAVFQGNGTTYVGSGTVSGSYYFSVTIVPDSALLTNNKAGTITNNYSYRLYYTGIHRPTTPDVNHSGSDLFSLQYGIGNVASKLVAFQSRTPDSAYTTSSDGFSALANQRLNGRYGTGSLKYNNNLTNTDGFGRFVTDYNDAGEVNFSANNTHVYYMFVREIPANFRNSIYKQDHGFKNLDEATITVTGYSTSNRFEFVDSTGGSVPITSTSFTGKISVINSDLFRIQINTSPNTDDLSSYPEDFSVRVLKPNPTYNSVYVANHKVTSVSDATYTTGAGGTAPNPLVSGTSYRVARLNDNRLKFKTSNAGSSAEAITPAFGNTSNSATNFNINLQDTLALTPTAATITKVEYRGDFAAANEFVVLTFYEADGTSVNSQFQIGDVQPKAFTSQWLTAGSWIPKDVSSLLRVDGGKTGIRVNVDPTGGVNAAPAGMSNWWELRFTVTANAEDVILTNQGTGQQVITVTGQSGAYDGTYEITEVPGAGGGKTFKIVSNFEIPAREFDFNGVAVDTANDIISLGSVDHNLLLGQKIEYDNNGGTDLVGADARYVIPVTNSSIRLANSKQDAEAGVYVQLTAISNTQYFRSATLIRGLRGLGTVSGSNGTRIITGDQTRFLSDFNADDELYTFVGGRMRKFIVANILTNTALTITEPLPAGFSAQLYFQKTTLNLRPDGYNLHKPFDGGVDITAGTSPNSKIVRQSRKYFRYQSGKGIQNSFAINFSPAKTLAKLTYDSVANKITAITQETHNLSVNDEITISNAEVTIGQNLYNGPFLVAEVVDPFTFKVTPQGTIDESVASGFPEYFRTSWRDSYIRAGMFDDQNGFFFEYDGDDVYAVRRSSTQQLSGTCSVVKNSQVIVGTNSSFTGQLEVSDRIVVRGQSYKVVAIDSDSRIVVQPPYRGVDADQVKITKTVDAKVKRTSWSIDKADGTGPSGYIFDPHKIQMGYADYSWYGAGKIRFGFKDKYGKVFYFHEFIHNNRLNESYFRSGNLPGRYEIENGDDPTTAPTLFHFGTSVIMDGRFDDDGAYKFSAISKPFVYANGATGSFTSSGNSTFEQITLRGKRVYVFSIPVSEANALLVKQGQLLRDSTGHLPDETYITQVKVLGASSRIYVNYPGTAIFPDPLEYEDIASGTTYTFGEVTATDLTKPVPLVSVRLAPSVDSSLVGFLGEREIINRMQLILDSASVTSNKEVDVLLVLNSNPSNLNFDNNGSPSLSQFIDHNTGDTYEGGVVLYSEKVSANSTGNFDLAGLIDMGNSILGGDGIFPSGPDLLTLAVQPTNTVGISSSTPFIVSGKLSWSESQA
jgi:hypothetical protein